MRTVKSKNSLIYCQKPHFCIIHHESHKAEEWVTSFCFEWELWLRILLLASIAYRIEVFLVSNYISQFKDDNGFLLTVSIPSATWNCTRQWQGGRAIASRSAGFQAHIIILRSVGFVFRVSITYSSIGLNIILNFTPDPTFRVGFSFQGFNNLL